MIHILDKKLCCGCSACVQRCPKHCIILQEDNEGFLYPKVNGELCINCGLCEAVCPEINQRLKQKPLSVYAAKNSDEQVRLDSSSGGLFSILAEGIIKQKGVVFGACFDENWDVKHRYTESKNDLLAFRGSKYVQSKIGNSFQQVESFLKEDRKVLFTGTPCQIAGLKSYLRKDYDNLLTVDIICHGVPSPRVWREYLHEEIAHQRINNDSVKPCSISDKNICIESISFRDKQSGWKKYSIAFVFSMVSNSGDKFSFDTRMLYTENPYMKGFLADLYLRPSCYACPAKCGKSGSDITLGDFWGIQNIMPELDDDKGVSVVLVNTERGRNWLNNLEIDLWEVDYIQAVTYNPALEKSSYFPRKREFFFAKSNLSVEKRVMICTRVPFKIKVKQSIRLGVSLLLSTRSKKLIKKLLGK